MPEQDDPFRRELLRELDDLSDADFARVWELVTGDRPPAAGERREMIDLLRAAIPIPVRGE